jgi:hypothetical protein
MIRGAEEDVSAVVYCEGSECGNGTFTGDERGMWFVVCVLFGCSALILLRRRESEEGDGEEVWQFVGECYLDGFMNWEVLGGCEEPRDSVLRYLYLVNLKIPMPS